MSRPLWKRALDLVGRLRFPFSKPKADVAVGVPDALDANGSTLWGEFARSEKLFAAWSPVPGGPWEPYHCAPLFAALDRIPQQKLGVTPTGEAEETERRLAPLAAWLRKRVDVPEHDTWIVLDLPGVESVALAPDLMLYGIQPVCTFDHWPHPAGLLRPEQILAQLLRYAPRVATLRKTLPRAGAPAWICDRARLGSGPGLPQQFDNRYFLDDSILPGIAALRDNKLRRVLYVAPNHGDRPLEDLGHYFEFLKKNGLLVEAVGADNPDAGPYAPPPPALATRFNRHDYARAAAGGFGRLIPSESSSSG